MSQAPGWRPNSGPDTARLRARMLTRARHFFAAAGVLEVDTPALSRAAVSDPHIESISASLSLDAQQRYYLHTSPEYFMKRLLCAGYPDIFQISKVFRDEEAGRFHQPEFTLVEWYRLDYGLEDMIEDTVAFIACLLDNEHLQSTPQHFSYSEAFHRFAKCDPFTAGIATLSDRAAASDSLRASLGQDRDAWLDLVLANTVVSGFALDKLTVVTHYPVRQAALARQCPGNAGCADRFEIFLGRHELANGYVELTDAKEHMRRFNRDQTLRQSAGLVQRPIDQDFIAAIEHGLPPCSGVAAGFDRLLMIRAGKHDIRRVQTFAFRE